MSKNHRGKGIYDKVKRGRGTCPNCKRTGVKIIYEREVDKEKITICKVCNISMSRTKIEKPENKTPASEKPENKTPAPEKPENKTPAPEKPETEQSTEKTENKTPAPEKPETEQSTEET